MKNINHGVHIILTLVTCGMWLPVWFVVWLCAPTIPVGGTSAAAVFQQQQMQPQYQYRPGDRVNGYVLMADGTWVREDGQ